MSMQLLSRGRCPAGSGTSGPQLLEAWHGVKLMPSDHDARPSRSSGLYQQASGSAVRAGAYQLPLPGGQGKAIRSMLPAIQVPIYVASLDPRVLEITGDLADGWIGNTFMPEHADIFTGRLRAGAAAMPSGRATTAANSSS
jgi:alkanesulfonate monooxygenase SsuD/methylene tetrahydromethanopterin reductase-like flavin-dependent oxidoreductase (luciferase family)